MRCRAGFIHKAMLIGLFAVLAVSAFAQAGTGLIPFHRQEVQTALATGDIATLQNEIYRNLQDRGGWVVTWTHVYDRATVVYWNNYEIHEYQYHGYHPAQLTRELVTSNTSGNWQNYQRLTPAYSNPMIFWQYSSYTIEVWQSNLWLNYYRTLYQYHQNDTYNTITGQMWQSNSWQNYTLSTYYYSGNNISHLVSQSWQSNGWVNSVRTEYVYDGQNRISQMVFSYWYNNAWQPSSRMVYSYNADDTYNVILTQVWNASGGNYTDSSRATYIYSQGFNSQVIYEAYTNGAWQYTSRMLYFRDASYNTTESIQQNYSSGWTDYSRRVMQYEFWDVANEDECALSSPLRMKLYPNPARELATLLINSAKSGTGKAEIYNLKGEKCGSQDIDAKADRETAIRLATAHLPAGIYLVRASVGGQQQTLRMLKLK